MTRAKIYTKTGDQGQTSLVGGARVPKTHARLEAYGTLDELNSVIGLIRSHLNEGGVDTDNVRALVETRLRRVQNCLFDIGSHLACADAAMKPHLPNIRADDITTLEADMDGWEGELPALKTFILPGGSHLASFAHLARTVCRRAERLVLHLESADVDSTQLAFLNRLSDWFFTLARKFNADAGVGDLLWSKD